MTSGAVSGSQMQRIAVDSYPETATGW